MNRNKGRHVREGELPEASKQVKKSRLTRQQKILLTACIVLGVVLALTLAYRALFQKPELPGSEDNPSKIEDVGEGIRPKADGQRKSKDYYTVLILGRDTGGGGNTDTMLLASYDVTNQKATVMSIPRDTMVNVPWDLKKINSVYTGKGGGEKGIKALYQEIAQLVGFEPDYQVVVEWEAVGKIVDAIGGVQFDVPRNMDYEDPYQDLSIHVKKGDQKLNGEQAMGVIRWRHNNSGGGYPDGDLGRIKTQQAFLKAVIEQTLQIKNVANINKFAKIFKENVETDLSVSNLFWFGKSAVTGGLSMENVSFVTMPNTPKMCWSRSVRNMQSYVVPNADELLELVNTALSPFVEKFTLSDLDIMRVNADGSVSSTTGHVEDSKAATAPSIPANPPVASEDDPPVVIPPTEETPGESTGGETTTPPTEETPGGETIPPTEETPGGETTPPTEETPGGTTGGEITVPQEPAPPVVVMPGETAGSTGDAAA